MNIVENVLCIEKSKKSLRGTYFLPFLFFPFFFLFFFPFFFFRHLLSPPPVLVLNESNQAML
jgi:hypothetical protein